MKVTTFVVHGLLAAAAVGVPWCATAGSDPGDIARDAVVVEVTSLGLGGWSYASVRCDGRVRLMVAVGDTLQKPEGVPPDTALALVNRLLSTDFMRLPDHYPSEWEKLRVVDGGMLRRCFVVVKDAGDYRITLRIQDEAKTVRVEMPAPRAPGELTEWIRDFWRLVRD